MALSTRTKLILRDSLADLAAGDDLATNVNAGAGAITSQAAITINTITPTSGVLPTANGATTIADTTAPTVVELLDLCVETRAKLNALFTLLTAAGVTH